MKHPVIALVALSLCSCSSDAPDSTDQTRATVSQQAPASNSKPDGTSIASTPKATGNPCDAIRDATFRSVEAFDSGVREDGSPAMGTWMVEFRGGLVRFQEADTSRTATYACADGEISCTSEGNCRGHYDASTGTLTGNGHPYERIKIK